MVQLIDYQYSALVNFVSWVMWSKIRGEFFEKFLNTISKEDSSYVLGFLRENLQESTVLNKKVKVGKMINKHLKALGERLGLSIKLKFKVSLDTYATCLKKGNVSIEKIAEMLGHCSTAVIRNSLDSFGHNRSMNSTNCFLKERPFRIFSSRLRIRNLVIMIRFFKFNTDLSSN